MPRLLQFDDENDFLNRLTKAAARLPLVNQLQISDALFSGGIWSHTDAPQDDAAKQKLWDAAQFFEDSVMRLAVSARDEVRSAQDLRTALIELVGEASVPLPIDVRAIVLLSPIAMLPSNVLAWAIWRTGRQAALALLLDALTDASAQRGAIFSAWVGRILVNAHADEAPRIEVPMNPLNQRAHSWRSDAIMQRPLQFALRGSHVCGNAIQEGTHAELVLLRTITHGETIHVIESSLFSPDCALDIDVLLLVTARGGVSCVGQQFAVARFEKGVLKSPVIFELEASGGAAANAAVHVDFLVHGERVHETEISLAVSSAYGSDITSGDPQPLREDPDLLGVLERGGTVGSPPRQQILLSLSLSRGLLHVSLADLRNGRLWSSCEYDSNSFDRVRLASLSKEIDRILAPCYANEDVWAEFDGLQSSVPGVDTAEVLQGALEAVAAAGSFFARELASDPEICKALSYVEANVANGAILSVTTDNVFFPWELLYPDDWPSNPSPMFRATHRVSPDIFWGYRFAIETSRRGSGATGELGRRYRAANPKVALAVNPDIKIAHLRDERQPLAIHRTWASEFGESGRLESMSETCGEVRSLLQDGVGEPTVIYVYCHGSSPNQLLGIGEELILNYRCKLVPSDLLSGPRYSNAPIVVLNSCRSGAPSTLSFSSFLSQFQERGALGMIGTSYAVPITFGAHFAREIIDCCFSPGDSLAERLLVLRQKHLREQGNPIPLFYTLLCHLH